ncbi:GntR family transcriptional regulator [Mediterraneibacter glycyrrhizinilyticus]|uniref:GntR family transcriptional regulator n=1 Tax=Mediterraneibacter glycyrrhizinilyticus TaxID=342942 RepID=UPI0025A3F14B|nr:GntR family transcriptional regulator [Mediterraneibacter glycyrrhizinilyticus]MDM8211672.1 GntR family transcriptional regulator [Mediterraneibacter glycyrrhizinilyticus]
MKIFINENSPRPIYDQIVQAVKNSIVNHELQAGDMLPSIRSLARDLGISVITTKRAYEELEKQGLIYSEQGKGFFVNKVNQNLLLESRLKEYEKRLRDMIREAKGLGLSPEEVSDMVQMFWDNGGEKQ